MSEMTHALKNHYPEYFMEAAELGILMMVIVGFSTLIGSPHSIMLQLIPDPFFRLLLIQTLVGLAVVGLVYSKWGQRSGIHINPVVSLVFYRLGKMKFWDMVFYIIFQCIGAILGVALTFIFFNVILGYSYNSVNYAPTIPGKDGIWAAFLGEFITSFIFMFSILLAINHPKLHFYAGWILSFLIIIFVVEVPYSGLSMNPARTLASSVFSGNWTSFWVYIVSPFIAMFLAAELYVALKQKVYCAKINHNTCERCIFNCEYEHGFFLK